MDKRLIAERFARARDTYSREARVQQQVAEKMLRLLAEHTSLFHRIVVQAVIPGYCWTSYNRKVCC